MSEEGMNSVPCTCAPTPYIATKIVEAVPMKLGQFHDTHPGQTFPGNPGDDGYCVIYPQIGEKKPYHGWCPKAQFEAMNQDPRKGMSFGHALVMLENGRKRVARAGWNGKKMWLGLVRPGTYVIYTAPYGDGTYDVGTDCKTLLPWIGMKTADDKFVPWLASQTDMLATDWVVFD